MKHRAIDLTPEGLTQTLTEYGLELDNIKDYDRIQNGTIVKMAERLDKMDCKIDSLKDTVNEGFNSLTKLIYEKHEATKELSATGIHQLDAKRSTSWRQVITWGIALLAAVPSCLWSLVQLFNAIVKH